jgi:hypothetical protein
VEIPDGWSIEEERLSIPSSACNLSHDLANYKIFNSKGSVILIQFPCWARGYGQIGPCPAETQILDEDLGIARSRISDIEYQYWHFSRTDGSIYCVDGWKIADQGNGGEVDEMADYKQYGGIVDLPTVDRIVMSIDSNSASMPSVFATWTPEIIAPPPTWMPTPTIRPSSTRTKAPTWTTGPTTP